MKKSSGRSQPPEDIERHERSKRTHFSIRINMFFFATFLLFSALIVKLAMLQFVEGKDLSAQETMQTKRPITISPIRGNIFDKDGYPIAYTISAQSLFYRIEPGQKKQDMIDLSKKLADIFAKLGKKETADNGEEDTVLDADEIIKRMDVGFDIKGTPTKSPSYTFWPRRIKADLTDKEIAYLTEHQDELKGTEIVEESTRRYAEEKVAVQLVGYLRQYSTAQNQSSSYLNYYRDNPGEYLNDEFVGFDGLEFLYQDDLRGKNGQKTYPVNSQEQIIGQVQITPPEKGHNLFLTIKKDVQEAAEKAITDQLAALKKATKSTPGYLYLGNKAVAGYAVAMEVDTGKVVAMASIPDYDPNVWSSGRISEQQWNAIQYKYTNGTITQRLPDIPDAAERAKHPSSLVPLGSTMKPLTVLLGFNEGMLTPTETYADPGTFYYGKDNSHVSNSDKHKYGTLTASSAIKFSSNTFMASMIGNRLYMSPKYKPFKSGQRNIGSALDVWDSYMKRFGLGTLTGSGLPGESPGIIEYYNSADKYSAQSALVYASFGQMGRYTTLQLAQYASMLANHGKRYKPQFVDKITTYDGKVLKAMQPQLLNQVSFPEEYWKAVEQGMGQVHVEGFDGVSYTFNRKTGTSQQQVGNELLENAVFIAYAPAVKPKLAVAVVVPEGGYGAWGAAPIARKIFDAYDQYVGLNGVPKGAKPQ